MQQFLSSVAPFLARFTSSSTQQNPAQDGGEDGFTSLNTISYCNSKLKETINLDSGNFPVTAKWSQVVAAFLPVQEHWLPMSNLDLLLPPLDFGIFLGYKNNGTGKGPSPENMVAVLKKALAQALVSFYTLAGEIVQNRHGEPEILCNNRGLKDIDLYRPDVSVHGKLVPVKMHGVLSVQVTELKYGGLFIGCTFDHRAAGDHTANMFPTAWAEIAQAKPIMRLPSFRRSLLKPRCPPQSHKSLDKLHAPLLPMPPPPSTDDQDHLTTATGNDCSKMVKLGIVVDGRTRLSGKTTSLESYFGNVLAIPYVEGSVGEIQMMLLKEVADMVHECVAMASTVEHFLLLIDWVEMRRLNSAVVKVYCKDENDEAAVVVSSGQRFPVQELDFGWGKLDFGSYHFPWGGETGYVMPVPSASGNGDWIVDMHLKKRYLDLIETRASHVFRPFSRVHI
ncbi:Alcohol O-acetyltransferase [Handroanthus impetiginosus]|uniref:Alcohol O-acetyltransferase n=1 Tax=Handroanthus impetiginosus TaxID=429701 RepID=A0A2G9H8N4_9LAMI|nr:Alcohol O-acetyltransferase [Handroanthus impetiginosus]